MMVVSDLDDEPFLPIPTDLIVSLTECRAIIEQFCTRLPILFKDTHETQNNLGAGLKAAHKILAPVGGKIVVLQATLPNAGEGALKDREDAKLLGTPKVCF